MVVQAAAAYNSSRVFVWRLIANVSVGKSGEPACPWPNRRVAGPTHLFGEVLRDKAGAPQGGVSASAALMADSSPSAMPATWQANSSNSNISSDGAREAYIPRDDLYALSFGYAASLLELPADAPEKLLQIQNVTLQQLPQLNPGGSRGRRRLRRRLLQGPSVPPGMWTLLLWPFSRWAWAKWWSVV